MPGTIVEVSPGNLTNLNRLQGAKTNKRFAGSEENAVGADEQQALQEVKEALDSEQYDRAQKKNVKESGLLSFFDDELFDLKEDLTSFRFLAFYNIPKVKFAVDFAFYLIYVVQLTFLAVNLRFVNPDCTTPLNTSCTNADVGYLAVAEIGWNESKRRKLPSHTLEVASQACPLRTCGS